MGGTSVCVRRTLRSRPPGSWAVTPGAPTAWALPPGLPGPLLAWTGSLPEVYLQTQALPRRPWAAGDLSIVTHGAQEGSGSLFTRSALGCTGPTAPLGEVARHPQQGQKQAPSIPARPGSPGLSCGGQLRDSQTWPQGGTWPGVPPFTPSRPSLLCLGAVSLACHLHPSDPHSAEDRGSPVLDT